MVVYEWICEDCKLYWERDYPIAKNPNRTKCPECKKLCERLWEATPVHFKGYGWSSEQKVGRQKSGGSDEVAQELIGSTKRRLKSGYQHYAKYTPKQEWLDNNTSRKLTPTESAAKMRAAKKATAHVYNKAGLDPSIPHKPQ